jgi:hypothetical protein
MSAPEPVTERAIALAGATLAGATSTASPDLDEAARELAASAGREALVRAQDELVGRIRTHSDDYSATAGLNLVNRALAVVGWPGPFDWRHRRKP